jgi:hypothetical protein
MVRNQWQGQTVFCIASGPSLTAEDCELVQQSGLNAIAVNSSWKRARFASVIYASDPGWWDNYGAEIDTGAECYTSHEQTAHKHNIRHYLAFAGNNSGVRAIELAIAFGAAKILLLGYDCSVSNGTHWHGNHTKTNNPDAQKCRIWMKHFAQLNKKKSVIINCSRDTALQCFPRMTLEDALGENLFWPQAITK